MNGQVESWKKIVSEMETRKYVELVGDSSSSKYLPNDSPSSDEDLEGEEWVKTQKYKPGTDLNDLKWEIGLRYTLKQDFIELIRHQGVKMSKNYVLRKMIIFTALPFANLCFKIRIKLHVHGMFQ